MSDINNKPKKKKQGNYKEVIAGVNPATEPTRDKKAHQPYSEEKKIDKGIAIGVAAAVAVAGVGVGVGVYNHTKDKANDLKDDTSIAGDENIDEATQENLEYVLSEEFYVSDAEVKQAKEDGDKTIVTVDEVIEDVNETIDLNTVKTQVEKGTKQDQDEINLKSMINYYNGTIERSDYSSDDAEGIFRETQGFLVAPYAMFEQNALDYATAKASLLGGSSYSGSLNDKVLTPGVILESKGDVKEYNNAFAKNLNEQLSDINSYNEQIKSIEKQIDTLKQSTDDESTEIKALEDQLSELNTEMNKEFDENAEEFYDLFEKINENEKLTDAQKSIYYNYIKAVASDYKLSSTQLEKINKELQSFANNANFFDVLKNFLTDEEYADIMALQEEDCTFGKPLTELGEKSNSSDEAEANSIAGTPNGGNEKHTVKQGGNSSSGSDGKSEQINNPSQSTVTETNVEKVPASENEQNDREDTVAGGEVVDEKTEVKEPEKVQEEIINPGQEETLVEEESTKFTDANGEDFEAVYSEEDFAMVLSGR